MRLIEVLVESARERARALPPRTIEPRTDPPSFVDALRGKDELAVIAEYKRKSPSLGDIAERSLIEQVTSYESAGAAAVSILTEPTHFRGSHEDLASAVETLAVPVLMKDFVVDVAQVREAAFVGASAVLLIVRCLSQAELDELAHAAEELGLTPLVECHDENEIDRALALESAVIGVNNRDLDTLTIDRTLAPRLLASIPARRVRRRGERLSRRSRCRRRPGDRRRRPRRIGTHEARRSRAADSRHATKRYGVKPLVKICGLTRPGDAHLAVSLGATHVGVVRTESSPRSVSPELARDVFATVESEAETVFVFKDVSLSQVLEDAAVARPKGVQLYDAGVDDVRAVAAEGYRVYRVYHMDEDSRSLPRFDPLPSASHPALLDVGGGGSGRSFDWALFGERAPRATFVAGGIRPDNVSVINEVPTLRHRSREWCRITARSERRSQAPGALRGGGFK